MVEPSTLQPEQKKTKPARWWMLVTLVAGAVGALAAIAGAGKGTYDVAPFEIELSAKPAPLGKTEFAVRAQGLQPAHAEAGTHASPIVFRATIVGVSTAYDPSDARHIATPHDASTFLAAEGKHAVRSFGFKLLGLALAGGAAGGLAVSFGRWRRVIGGMLAGLLTIAVIGVLVHQTYDRSEFLKTQFVVQPAAPLAGTDG